MNGWTNADLVADLRGCADVDRKAGFDLNAEVQERAADRLTELQAREDRIRRRLASSEWIVCVEALRILDEA